MIYEMILLRPLDRLNGRDDHMKLMINGKDIATNGSQSVTELLKEQKVKWPDMVSVELNGKILKRESFASTALQEGDKLEFLYFMGGGCESK